MLGHLRLLPDAEAAQVGRLRLGEAALHMVGVRQPRDHQRELRVLLAMLLAGQLDRPFSERKGFRVPALAMQSVDLGKQPVDAFLRLRGNVPDQHDRARQLLSRPALRGGAPLPLSVMTIYSAIASIDHLADYAPWMPLRQGSSEVTAQRLFVACGFVVWV